MSKSRSHSKNAKKTKNKIVNGKLYMTKSPSNLSDNRSRPSRSKSGMSQRRKSKPELLEKAYLPRTESQSKGMKKQNGSKIEYQKQSQSSFVNQKSKRILNKIKKRQKDEYYQHNADRRSDNSHKRSYERPTESFIRRSQERLDKLSQSPGGGQHRMKFPNLLPAQTESSELVIHPDRYRPVRGGTQQPIIEDKESNTSYCVVEDPQRMVGSYEKIHKHNLSGTSALSSFKRSNNNLDVSEHLSPYRRAKYSAMIRKDDERSSSPEISPLRRGRGILKASSNSPVPKQHPYNDDLQ